MLAAFRRVVVCIYCLYADLVGQTSTHHLTSNPIADYPILPTYSSEHLYHITTQHQPTHETPGALDHGNLNPGSKQQS